MSYNTAFLLWSDKKRSELRGVESTLKECAEIKGFKRGVHRKELLGTIQQQDRTLTTILDTFQVSYTEFISGYFVSAHLSVDEGYVGCSHGASRPGAQGLFLPDQQVM
jgi:hypothetical protein